MAEESDNLHPRPQPPLDSIMKEAVDHPSHYGGDTIYEHVKVAEALGWVANAFIYNATKYLWRLGKKEESNAKIIEDLKKAIWYLQREVQRRERV